MKHWKTKGSIHLIISTVPAFVLKIRFNRILSLISSRNSIETRFTIPSQTPPHDFLGGLVTTSPRMSEVTLRIEYPFEDFSYSEYAPPDSATSVERKPLKASSKWGRECERCDTVRFWRETCLTANWFRFITRTKTIAAGNYSWHLRKGGYFPLSNFAASNIFPIGFCFIKIKRRRVSLLVRIYSNVCDDRETIYSWLNEKSFHCLNKKKVKILPLSLCFFYSRKKYQLAIKFNRNLQSWKATHYPGTISKIIIPGHKAPLLHTHTALRIFADTSTQIN